MPLVLTYYVRFRLTRFRYDREKAKHHAKQNAEHLYSEHYERDQGADQYDPQQYGPPRQIQEQFGGYDQGGYGGGNQGGYGDRY